jgi:hypothetical protein
MTYPLPGHVQQLTTQMASLDVFSHVVECISFSNWIMLFVRLSLICGEILATCAQYTHS